MSYIFYCLAETIYLRQDTAGLSVKAPLDKFLRLGSGLLMMWGSKKL